MSDQRQRHGDANWPECWLFYRRGDIALGDRGGAMPERYEHGDRTRIEHNGSLTYSCACGSMFNRMPGFRNEEARTWIVQHAPHVAAAPQTP